METTEQLKQLFEPVFRQFGVNLYEMIWVQNGREKTLQVAISRPDGSMDIDTCADVSEKLSQILDEHDPVDGEYTLEVCSPGAEREIRNIRELTAMKGAYVHIRLNAPVAKRNELEGEILDTDENSIVLGYRDKAAKRQAEIALNNITFARLAVRI